MNRTQKNLIASYNYISNYKKNSSFIFGIELREHINYIF